MQALDLLLTRHSCARLSVPAPEGEELENIWRAGLRAPDHGGLSPWRFIHVSGEGLDKLSDIYVKATEAADGDIEKAKQMPYRAPIITIVVASPKTHSKVPEIEQVISAGCAVHSMQMAALALGYNGIWRTGDLAYSDVVKQELGLEAHESIVGYLYLGTPQIKCNRKQTHDYSKYVSSL